MNNFTNSVSKIFKGALNAFKTFPVSIVSALAFAIVALIRIQLDVTQQEPINFLLNCLSWGLALGAIFGLAAITAVQSWYNKKKAFIIANLITLILVAVTVLMLYLFSQTNIPMADSGYVVISSLATARVGVAILVSLVAFIIFAGYPKDKSGFAHSFFMTQKALFIALLYGGVLMAGATGVAGAIQTLLYSGMSGKVYLYIATISGFLAFTVFVGYFPDFRKGEEDEHREVAQNQPRFIEILFEYIMIPIMIALTLVLLLWSGKTVLGGMKAPFIQLSGIAAAYTAFGIWLHIMVTHYKTGLATFYRKAYPFAALAILAIEAWALIVQLLRSSLKTTEYSFILIWIIAVASSILLILLKEKSHQMIASLICIMAVIAVLPFVGYRDLPVTAQANRLEKLLNSEGMIQNNQLNAANKEPDRSVRESITDAVNFLAYAQDAKLPSWFDPHLKDNTIFKNKLGFEQIWPNTEDSGNENYINTSLTLSSEILDISDYQWAVKLQNEKPDAPIFVESSKGKYQFSWIIDQAQGIPTLKITLNDKIIIEKNMKDYLDRVASSYPSGKEPSVGSLKEMSLQFETPEVSVLIVFKNISINIDKQGKTGSYWLELDALYMKEK